MGGPMYGIPCAELEMMYKGEELINKRKKHVVRAKFAYSAEKQPPPFAIEIGNKSVRVTINESDVDVRGRKVTCGDILMGQSGQSYIVIAICRSLLEIRAYGNSFSPHRMYFDLWDRNRSKFIAIRQWWIEGSSVPW